MAYFSQQLENLSLARVRELLEKYHVKTHDRKTYNEPLTHSKANILIESWLSPEEPVVEGDILKLIRGGLAFKPIPSESANLMNMIFEQDIKVSAFIIDDFAKYPIKRVFDEDPWVLLKGYIRSSDRNKYFKNITGEDHNDFLNNTERIFYLTRGYGRPNKYISQKDMDAREFYIKANPTALLVLMDIVGMCPLKQDPENVLENLSDVDLTSIDVFHNNAVSKISECLGKDIICTNGDGDNTIKIDISECSGLYCEPTPISGYTDSVKCDASKTKCFKHFLNSIGILDVISFDPTTEAFKSNLSQLNLYRNVVPNKKYDFEEIKNQSRLYVESVISRLSDKEILSITVPSGIKFSNYVDLNNTSERLRSTLILTSIDFLMERKYFLNIEGNTKYIVYGRPIDDNFLKISSHNFINFITSIGALIDPSNNIISLSVAEEINKSLNNDDLSTIINKTKNAKKNAKSILDSSTLGDKNKLKQEFLNLPKDFTLEELMEALLGNTWAMKLTIWQETYLGWNPVSINFDTYLNEVAPKYIDLIKDTVKYYIQVL